MTDGERLVWAASYALALERAGDSMTAVRTATRAIIDLREAATLRMPDGSYVIAQIDERHFVDEMVNAP